MKHGLQDQLLLGNLHAERDWGYAPEYVEGMWRMLQRDRADDYVLATGVSHTVKEFADLAFAEAGMHLEWVGEGEKEQGLEKQSARCVSLWIRAIIGPRSRFTCRVMRLKQSKRWAGKRKLSCKNWCRLW
jgi:GDP-D-mannose dehydratase